MNASESERKKRWAELDAEGKALDREHRKLDRKWKEHLQFVEDLQFIGCCIGLVVIVVALPIAMLVKFLTWALR